MDVKHRLPAVIVGVDHHSIPALVDLQFFSDFRGGHKEMAEDFFVGWSNICKRADLFFRNNHDVNRSLRMDIAKCQADFVFKDDVGWNFAIDDFAEDRRHVLLHEFVVGAAAAFAWGPAWTQHVGGFAVDTVRSVDDESVASALVHARWANVRIKIRHFA